jgi:hypothetical protein
VTAPVHDGSGDLSHAKTVVLSNSPGVSHTAEIREEVKTTEDEADGNHHHEIQSTFQEQDKSEGATVPQP